MRQELIASGIIITFTTGDKSKSRSQSFLGLSHSQDPDHERSIVPLSVRKMMDEMEAVNTAALYGSGSSKPGTASPPLSPVSGGRGAGPETHGSKESDSPGKEASANAKAADKKGAGADGDGGGGGDDDGDDYDDDDYEDEFEDDDDQHKSVRAEDADAASAARKAEIEQQEAEEKRLQAEKAEAAEREAAEAAAAEADKKAKEAAERARAEREARDADEAARAAAEERRRREEQEEAAAEKQRQQQLLAEEEEKRINAEKAEAEWQEAERIAKEASATGAAIAKSDKDGANDGDDDEYGDDDYEDDDFEDDGHSRGPTPRKKAKTPDAKKRTAASDSPTPAVAAVAAAAAPVDNEQSKQTAATNEDDDLEEGVNGRPFKKYDYYHGDYSELKVPLETKVVGYVSKIDVSPARVEFGNSKSGSNANSRVHSAAASPSADTAARKGWPAQGEKTSPKSSEASSASSSYVPSGTRNNSATAAASDSATSYVPSSSGSKNSLEKQSTQPSSRVKESKDDDGEDDDDYLHYALYGKEQQNGKDTSAAVAGVPSTSAAVHEASLEKKPSPSSITEVEDAAERKLLSNKSKRAATGADDEYGADDFDEYEISFDENDS